MGCCDNTPLPCITVGYKVDLTSCYAIVNHPIGSPPIKIGSERSAQYRQVILAKCSNRCTCANSIPSYGPSATFLPNEWSNPWKRLYPSSLHRDHWTVYPSFLTSSCPPLPYLPLQTSTTLMSYKGIGCQNDDPLSTLLYFFQSQFTYVTTTVLATSS